MKPARLEKSPFTSTRVPIYPSFPAFAAGGRILWHYPVTGDAGSGTYLQFGDRVEKILHGHQLSPTVSPNGYKFLYVKNSGQYDSLTHNPRESNRLEFIDLCKEHYQTTLRPSS